MGYYTSRKEDRSEAMFQNLLRRERCKIYIYAEGYDSCSDSPLLFDSLLQQGDTARG